MLTAGRDSLHRLLECLSDGQVHSGESLGEQLGISRAAIWKHIKTARALGVSLKAVRGEGYQAETEFEMLDSEKIRAVCHPDILSAGIELEVLMSVDSTNTRVMQRLQEGRLAPLVVLAEKQTAGRGRRGRIWHSPFASNVYLTFGFTCVEGFAAIEGLSLVAGLQVVKALHSFGVSGLGLKWPNDVYWNQRKLAGILIEVQGDPSGMCQVAIGVGINVNMQDGQASLIDQPWVDLATIMTSSNNRAGSRISRNQLIGVLLNHLAAAVRVLPQDGFAAFQREWQTYDVCYGQPVIVQSGNTVMAGDACGVNSQGAYCVDVPAAGEGVVRHYISGGEISLRLTGETRKGKIA